VGRVFRRSRAGADEIGCSAPSLDDELARDECLDATTLCGPDRQAAGEDGLEQPGGELPAYAYREGASSIVATDRGRAALPLERPGVQ